MTNLTTHARSSTKWLGKAKTSVLGSSSPSTLQRILNSWMICVRLFSSDWLMTTLLNQKVLNQQLRYALVHSDRKHHDFRRWHFYLFIYMTEASSELCCDS